MTVTSLKLQDWSVSYLSLTRDEGNKNNNEKYKTSFSSPAMRRKKIEDSLKRYYTIIIYFYDRQWTGFKKLSKKIKMCVFSPYYL